MSRWDWDDRRVWRACIIAHVDDDYPDRDVRKVLQDDAAARGW